MPDLRPNALNEITVSIATCLEGISEVHCVSESTCKSNEYGHSMRSPIAANYTMPDLMPSALSEISAWIATCVAGISKVLCVSKPTCKTHE
jgi:hypothetical protein